MTNVRKMALAALFCSGIVPAYAQDQPLLLQVPIAGKENVDWAISFYVDLDPAPRATRDYMGGPHTFDGHKGVDFNVPNFRQMDANTPVFSSAPGRVVRLNDGNFDRNMARRKCRSPWNYVTIEHPNGWRSTYGHFQKWSIRVEIGQEVVAGQQLGFVGSSGCSSAPHVHFELRDDKGYLVDPFVEDLWEDAPDYDIPLRILDYAVNTRRLVTSDEIKDPHPNISLITPDDSTISVSFSIIGVKKGDNVRVILRNGGTIIKKSKTFDRPSRLSLQGWNFKVEKTSGMWLILVYLNQQAEPAVRHEVRVVRR